MKLLFDDALAPITSEMGLIECDVPVLLDAFVRWQSRVMTPLGVDITEKPVTGSLREVLLKLLPLTGPRRRRYLFVPTMSAWVAFFDNGPGGTDAFSVPSYLAKQLSCRALRVVAVPDTAERPGGRGRYGARVLELFGPGGGPLGHIRSISLVNDGGEWVFEQYGEPFPFERVEKYSRRKLTERFTFEDLREYAAALGVRPFDEDFYRSENARLVELTGALPSGAAEFTLEKVRARF